MQKLRDVLTELLQAEQAFISDGAILKNAVVEAALSMDQRLLKLLLKSETIKAHFFAEVDGTLVFDKVRFKDFVSNKAFLPDSYTAFKNRIGLTNGHGHYLDQSHDVVLTWPYKDCVLEGGMTKDDRARNEVFWNTTLAPDDITRLFEPKVLTNWERWDKEAMTEGKAKSGEGGEHDNLLIRGNNLLVLHSLKTRYAGKVKLIYIDPPYNTGNDEFRYNDRFNHSSWLTFMQNRLAVAKELLSHDGTICISIDINESSYLSVLMDEIFGSEQFCYLATVKRGSATGHKVINQGIVNVAEYVVAYAKRKSAWKPNRVYRKRPRNQRYNSYIVNRSSDPSAWVFSSLLDAFSEYIGIKKESLHKELGNTHERKLYDFVKENADSVVQFAYPDASKVSKETKSAIVQSKANPEQTIHVPRPNEADIYLRNGQRILFYRDRLAKVDGETVTSEPVSDIWDDVLPNDLHTEGGVSLKKGKKPEKLLQRIISIATDPGDIVLDFHVGSGTTAAVAHKMGRRWIAVEQMDYIRDLTLPRLKSVIEGEQSGISKAVEWKGGGSFVYAELAASNSAFADRVEAAQDIGTLQDIHADIQSTGYLRHDVDLSAFDAEDFAGLPLDDAKRVLMDCLDANHLYVNLGSLNDADFEISDEDAHATRSFYGLEE